MYVNKKTRINWSYFADLIFLFYSSQIQPGSLFLLLFKETQCFNLTTRFRSVIFYDYTEVMKESNDELWTSDIDLY